MEIKAEIISIGDEIISGDIVDTNSAYLSKELQSLGIECLFHSSIGDNEKDIKTVLDRALERSNIILFTGGLGPTDDDLTVKSVSKALGRELVFEDKIWESIQKILVNAGRNPDIYNKTQAYIPEGAQYFLNFAGTAPAIFIEIKDKKIFLLPGVPSEVEVFWDNNIKSILQNLSKNCIKVRKLLFSGISEAMINEKLGDIAFSNNPKVAFLPKSSEIILKLTATADTESKVEELLKDIEHSITDKIGAYCYGHGKDRVEEALKDILVKNNLKLSLAESCTGGLVSKLLTDISGSSEYISLNLVTYSNEAKMRMLNVKEETLKNHGAVSEQTAIEMAQGVKELSGNEIGVGITGIAGPTGGQKKRPVGLVYVGFYMNNNKIVHKLNFPEKLPREEIRMRAAKKTLHLLKDFLLNCIID